MTEMHRQVQSLLRTFLVALSLAIVVGSGCRYLQQPYTYHGSVIETPVAAPDFTLIDQQGHPFRLSDQTGHVALLFFGYTHCPDVCPTVLGQLRRVQTQLGSAAQQTHVIFVTVDPERDTPESLNAYLKSFDETFIGLSGNVDDMGKVWQSYGVYREKQPIKLASGKSDAYSVDHSTRLYLIDMQGHLRLTYTMDTNTDELVADIQHVLQSE